MNQGISLEPDSGMEVNSVRHVIAVLSGKGGVGKSLVSSLLATALRRQGYTVGVLDADITGPSIPKMFFPERAQIVSDPKWLRPAITETGIKVMSINLMLQDENQAVIWRGPLVARAIQQFWNDVMWGQLDYLIVDLPPGTSDASLTVMQSIPLSGAILVTAPQSLAGMVVMKASHMANRLQIPILGLVENMSFFTCPETGKQHDIFGPSHAQELAESLDVAFLGRLPVDPEIAVLCDQGKVEHYPAERFKPIADHVVATAKPATPPVELSGPPHPHA
jgi:ATP-binding protein involved in chromosome partitioning